jgi:hypothetical protein
MVELFSKNWYRGEARLAGLTTLFPHIDTLAAQAVAVAFSREGAMVMMPVDGAEATSLALSNFILTEGGNACLIAGATPPEWIPGVRAAIPHASRLHALVHIEAGTALAFASSHWPERANQRATGTLGLTIKCLAAEGLAPEVASSAIFEVHDDSKRLQWRHALEARAIFNLSQAVRGPQVRTNAVRIEPERLARTPEGNAYLEEIAMAFVYLATKEAADLNGMILAKEEAEP